MAMSSLLDLTGRIVAHRTTQQLGKVLETDFSNVSRPRYLVAFTGYKTASWQSLITIRLATRLEVLVHNA